MSSTVEICAGLGGLALGMKAAGFDHKAVLELDATACDTIRANMNHGLDYCKGWPLKQSDVREVDFTQYGSDLTLLSGGVPCQPFSAGGKRLADKDVRNLFPEMLRAHRELLPKAVVIENVRGLSFESSRPYVEYIIDALAKPHVPIEKGESWTSHHKRIRRADKGSESESYHVGMHLFNAANYGVPQTRERVFIVGIRKDAGTAWVPPAPSHSLDALLWDQFKDGNYWKRHGIKRRPSEPESWRMKSRLHHVKNQATAPSTKPWQTVRDAICELPSIAEGQRSRDDPMHYRHPGARSYDKHTGSLRDAPSKTLKAGAHGVPGGENTLSLQGGRVRYYTPREAALIQTLPKQYFVAGSWIEQMRQIGNAVPVHLATAVGKSIQSALAS